MPAGRPPKFSTPEELESKVSAYFEHIKGEEAEREIPNPEEEGDFIVEKYWLRNPEPPTITGLCLFLGFESRQSFHDYAEKDDFSYALKKARMQIECEYEKSLHFARNPAGSIFALKNLGWKDKQEVENTGAQKIEVVWDKSLLPPTV